MSNEGLEISRDFGLSEQIRRAAVSTMSNIAEGFERQNNKELTRFLYIARGSCGEVRSMCYLAFKLEYISKQELNEIYKRCTEISKMLFGFIRSL